jgi:peroxiredoxin
MAGKKKKKKGIGASAIVIVVVVVLAVVTSVLINKRSFEPVIAGTTAINFIADGLDGKLRRLDEFKGKVIFLNLWATWCKPCEEEMPSMQRVYNILKERNFEMIALSVDTKGGPDVVRKFVERYDLTFTVLLDPKGKIKDGYKTTGVPETFIIDQNGVIAEKIWGPRNWDDKRNLKVILDLLDNGPKEPQEYMKKKSSRK